MIRKLPYLLGIILILNALSCSYATIPDKARKTPTGQNISFMEDYFSRSVENNNVFVTRLLLIAGMNPNVTKTKNGCTVFQNAVMSSKIEIIKAMLENGADVNDRSCANYPLSYAVIRATRTKEPEIVKLLLKHGANIHIMSGGYPLLCLADDDETIKLLIANGADINDSGQSVTPPIFHAILWNDFEKVKLLVANGADINLKKNKHDLSTPLMDTAAWGKRDAIALFLIEKSANVNARNERGINALMLAVSGEEIEIVKALLAKGADVNTETENHDNALKRAVAKNNIPIMQLLMDKGAVADGKTVFEAACQGHAEVVKLLLSKGALQSMQSKDAREALSCAASNGHFSVVQILHDQGVK